MPSQDPRNHDVSASQSPSLRRPLMVIFLALSGGIMIGCIFPEPMALAAGVGVLMSWVVGIAVVAPRAARLSKLNLLHSLADPGPEDLALIEGASMHLIGNASRLAADPETRKLFQPIWQAFVEQVNTNWDMSLKNLASQREKGIGVFNPNNGLPPEMMERQLFEQIKAQFAGSLIDPICNAVGFEGRQKENLRAWMMLRFAGAFGPDGSDYAQPALMPGGSGLDFRSR